MAGATRQRPPAVAAKEQALTAVIVFAIVIVVSFIAWAIARMAALGDREDR